MIDYCLNYSMDNNAWLMMIYQKNGEITQRQIKVLKIYDDRISAYCRKAKGYRTFKIENILAVEIIKENENNEY